MNSQKVVNILSVIMFAFAFCINETSAISPLSIISEAANGKCLDVNEYPDYNSNINGGKVQIYDCKDAPNQKWYIEGKQIKNQKEKCLDVNEPDYNIHRNGAKVQMWQCTGHSNQQWNFIGTNKYEIKTPNGFCLEVAQGQERNYGTVQLSKCNGQPNQRWRLSYEQS